MSISSPSARPDRSQEAILAAVLDDVRNTLRVGWVDPSLRTLAFEPTFLSAAWAATRPNVTRSFAAGAERLQREAVEAARQAINPADVSDWARTELSGLQRERLYRTTQALHHSAARVYLVVQAWAVLAQHRCSREPARRKPPAKRGIPSWQEDARLPPVDLAGGRSAHRRHDGGSRSVDDADGAGGVGDLAPLPGTAHRRAPGPPSPPTSGGRR